MNIILIYIYIESVLVMMKGGLVFLRDKEISIRLDLPLPVFFPLCQNYYHFRVRNQSLLSGMRFPPPDSI